MPRQEIKTITNINDIQDTNATSANSLNAEYFNSIKKAVEESVYTGTNDDNGSDIRNTICTFTETTAPTARTNIKSGEKLSNILTKIQNYLLSLTSWAFKPSSEKIKTDEIGDNQITTEKLGKIITTPADNENSTNGFTATLIQEAGTAVGIALTAKNTTADTGTSITASSSEDNAVSFKVRTADGDKIVTFTW